MSPIQFGPGLSLLAFLADYGSEQQYDLALEQARWPEGFRCRRCHSVAHCMFRVGARKNFQCSIGRTQTSLIAGSLFQGTHLALAVWFLAAYLISQAKTGL